MAGRPCRRRPPGWLRSLSMVVHDLHRSTPRPLLASPTTASTHSAEGSAGDGIPSATTATKPKRSVTGSTESHASNDRPPADRSPSQRFSTRRGCHVNDAKSERRPHTATPGLSRTTSRPRSAMSRCDVHASIISRACTTSSPCPAADATTDWHQDDPRCANDRASRSRPCRRSPTRCAQHRDKRPTEGPTCGRTDCSFVDRF